LQPYTGISDDEAMEAMVMDRRWQLVLDCLGANESPFSPFSKWTLLNFRERLIEGDLDRRLIERTVEVARSRGGFSERRLRALWTPPRCGGREGWRTPTTSSWDTL
jgi:hypothetical protein